MPTDKKIKPYQSRNLEDYSSRKKAYDDSLQVYNASLGLHKSADILAGAILNNKISPDVGGKKLEELKKSFNQKYNDSKIDTVSTRVNTITNSDNKIAAKLKTPKYQAPIQEVLPPKEIASEQQRNEAKKRITGLERSTRVINGIPQIIPTIPTNNINTINTLPIQEIKKDIVMPDIMPYNKPKAITSTYNTYGNPNAPKGYIQPEGSKKIDYYNDEELNKFREIYQFKMGGKLRKYKNNYNYGGLLDDQLPISENMINDNRALTQANASINNDIALRKKIVGGVAGASKLLDMVVPGLGTGVSTGLNFANSFANGGNMLTEIPNNAGTHENNPNGGVNINGYNASVEEGETIDNKNKFVFSNRLKPMNSNKTYADMTKTYKNKMKLRPDDKLTKDFVQGKLEELAQDQEAQKAYMSMVNEATNVYNGIMAMGGFMDYSNGGKIKIKPENKGKFTASAKNAGMGVQEYANKILANKDEYSPLQVKRANFAHVFGGRNFADGGNLDELYKKYKESSTGMFEDADSLKATGRYTEDYLNSLLGNNTPNIAENNATGLNPLPLEDTSLNQRFRPTTDMGLISPIASKPFDTSIFNQEQPSIIEGKDSPIADSPVTNKRKFNAGKAIPYTQLLGPTSQMLTSLVNRNKDLANLNYKIPEYNPIDEFYASKIAERGQNIQTAGAKSAIRAGANTQGNYLANIANLEGNVLDAPNQAANLALQANMQNQAGRNQYETIKANTINKNIDERERSLDNSRTQFTNALYNAGATGAGIYKDTKQTEQDTLNNELFAKNFSNLFSNFQLSDDGTLKYKKKFGGKLKKY